MLDQDDQDTESLFTLRLTFPEEVCPGCERLGPAGECPKCGQEVPDTDGIQKLVDGRIAAFAELLDESKTVLSSFDSPPEARMTVDLIQFYRGYVEVNLIERLMELGEVGQKLASLDLDDMQVVGGSARKLLVAKLEHLKIMRADIWELCLLDIAGPGEDLRDLAIEIGQQAARLMNCLLRILSETDIDRANNLTPELQDLMELPYADRLADINKTVESAFPDDDARIGGLVGVPGSYTDERGWLDMNALSSAFAGSEEPLEALGRQATSYFQRILGLVPSNSGTASLLLWPAVNLTTLDNPLLGHRMVRQSYRMAARAYKRDPQGFRRVSQRIGDQARIIFSAASRIHSSFLRLAAGDEAGLSDSESVVTTALRAYQEIGESTYRLFGWVAADLDLIADGGIPEEQSDAPMLGSLVESLVASTEPTAHQLGVVFDSELRNVVAHSRFEWDSENHVLESLQSDRCWDIDELESLMDRLVATVVGIDAGLACFFVEEDIELDATLSQAGVRDVNLFALTLTFGSRGLEVTDFDQTMGTVYVTVPDAIDPTGLLPPLAGMAGLSPEAESYTLRNNEDGYPVLLEIEGDVVRKANKAPQFRKDLATLEIALSAMVASGRDSAQAHKEIAILGAKIVGVCGLQQIVEQPDNDSLREISKRADYWLKWLDSFTSNDKHLKRLKPKLGSIAVNAARSEFGDQAYIDLVNQLTALGRWAEKRGVVWPPRMGQKLSD